MHEPSPIEGKKKTDALWSIESDAYLCDTHSLSGVDVTMIIAGNKSRSVSLRALADGRAGEPRRRPIRQVRR